MQLSHIGTTFPVLALIASVKLTCDAVAEGLFNNNSFPALNSAQHPTGFPEAIFVPRPPNSFTTLSNCRAVIDGGAPPTPSYRTNPKHSKNYNLI